MAEGRNLSRHRPTQGWTVNESLLLCQVSKLPLPSSLGLDDAAVGEELFCKKGK